MALPLGLLRFVPLRLAVALILLLATLPAVTQAGFPLGSFVNFARVEVKQALPSDEHHPIKHVAPSDADASPPSFDVVAPAELPLGLMRVEQSTPGTADHVELLYRNQADTALLITQLPAEIGMVTLDQEGTRVETVRGDPVLITLDPRPDAVSSITWERDGVFFQVLVTEAPMGEYGGFKRTNALTVVEAMMDAQDDASD